MSQAWMDPVVVWKEPRRGALTRVGGRAAIALGWTALAILAPWPWFQGAAAVLAVMAGLHTALAVANRIRSKGAVLVLMGSGTIEWHQSLQEKWLKRPIDWVDGTSITVITMPKFPGYAWTDPRVLLKGATHKIEYLPLYGTGVADFIEAVNSATAGRGITFVPEGERPVTAALKAARRGTRRPPAAASDA